MKKILTLKDLNEYLNISISEIRKLVREHKIPNFRIGNRIMFELDDINNWIDNLKEKERGNTLYY